MTMHAPSERPLPQNSGDAPNVLRTKISADRCIRVSWIEQNHDVDADRRWPCCCSSEPALAEARNALARRSNSTACGDGRRGAHTVPGLGNARHRVD